MDITEMFQQRDIMFSRETKNLLSAIDPTIIGITQYLDTEPGLMGDSTLEWEGVNLVDDMVTVVGVIHYTPGTQLMVDGGLLDITDNNCEYFQQIVRVGIPIDVVATQSADTIYAYLVNLPTQTSDVENTDTTTSTPMAGFDVSILTPDQQVAIVLPPSGNIH